MVKILSLGGSIVAPDGVDTEFLKKFKTLVESYLAADPDRKLILVIGGGAPARVYQKAFREIEQNAPADVQDWIGITATRLNAQLVKSIFGSLCKDPVVTDPSADISFTGRILVGAGWKPGFSTDFDAVYLAERFGGKTVVNLSNIVKVYTDDPKKNPDAKPLDKISWVDFQKMVGTEWVPGKNVPFDPIAAQKAKELALDVIVAGGKDIENIGKILEDKPYIGTLICP
ncbi:MAG: UMP kinase [Spirochaetia bacterium]|nr:UMP kinase [Spirochaetia bacterium]